MFTRLGGCHPRLQHSFLFAMNKETPAYLASSLINQHHRTQTGRGGFAAERREDTGIGGRPCQKAVLMSDLEGYVTFASQQAVELHGCEVV